MLLWLVAAVVVALVHRSVPSSGWLLVHLVLLGALGHSILVWSMYFAQALLKAPLRAAHLTAQNTRLAALMGGTLMVLIGYPSGWWWLVLTGAAVAVGAVLWHGAALWRMLRDSLTARFRVTIHYYVAAAVCLAAGATLGVLLGRGPADPWHSQLLLSHSMLNLLGWVGLTVTGTLVTFWPTLLRTRMDDRAARLAGQALPVLLTGLAVLVTGGLTGLRSVALTGLFVYLLGLLWWARALIRPLRAKPPREFSAASVGCALVWGVVGISWVGWLLAFGQDWESLGAGYAPVSSVFAAGFAAQLLLGALSHLVPTVLGGGPKAVRAALDVLNRAATVRVVVVNGGLALYLLPVPSWVRVTVSAVILVGLAVFIPLLVAAIRASLKARRDTAAGTPPVRRELPRLWSARQLLAGAAVLILAVATGIGLDPTAVGLNTTGGSVSAGEEAGTGARVQPTGETVHVDISAHDMAFFPNRVSVRAGDRLVLTVTNDDATNTHDLSVGGERTPRLAPGEAAELDVGVVSGPLEGLCTIAGHAAMGMTFAVDVDGGAAAGSEGHGHAEGQSPAPFIPPRPGAELVDHVDPVLEPLGEARVHEVTLTVTEVPLEVAPGQWQTRWTFNGGNVGPTLHGRVGDVFEVTLVNDGTIGHSVDFHAGALAPDGPMRTIQPGQSLEYRFTAERAGVWMYHCATEPMSAHIAAGMHGAVVIEPEGLDEVDRSYVLVQSELYLGNDAGAADEATEVEATKVLAQTPDRVVFNGIANQYDASPLTARVGERVRFWMLNAGPNEASSLHVVGGQFDTTYLEGAYHLDRGEDAFGHTGNGAQALALQPGQGGFVELVFPEAGHYPVVSHVMSDAEKGAHGVVEVTP
ncbi:multicopper oxidase domain-containing protein [Microbacterium sp. A93]|uniref:multicopper oxidase domain-containing protein n=1 Tax=Microbacterium sp. A93 TaxID=3450716 RepID=UPI003F422F6D